MKFMRTQCGIAAERLGYKMTQKETKQKHKKQPPAGHLSYCSNVNKASVFLLTFIVPVLYWS